MKIQLKYILFLLIAFSIFANPDAIGCEFRDESYDSKILPANPNAPWRVRYLVVLPKNFNKQKQYGAVYFLHGRNSDRRLIQQLDICNLLDRWVDRGGNPFIIIAPDGGNSYWMNGALTHLRWGDVISQELVSVAESNYPLIQNKKARVLAGISMGGHGAIQLSLNHPEIFGAIAAHSPVFRTQEEASRDFYYEFGTGVDFQLRDPFSLMMIHGKRFKGPLYLDMGGQDPWLANTRNFALYLNNLGNELGINTELHIAEDQIGGHAIEYWRYHLGSYLEWYAHHLP